jgi:hypothetical protein
MYHIMLMGGYCIPISYPVGTRAMFSVASKEGGSVVEEGKEGWVMIGTSRMRPLITRTPRQNRTVLRQQSRP